MGSNTLGELRGAGQSVWLDFISRDIIMNGELSRLIEEDGVSGITSNPSIIQKAIAEGRLYDDEILDRVCGGVDPEEVFRFIAYKDVRAAAELLTPLFLTSRGTDGFASIELDPRLAKDAEGSLKAARQLFGQIEHPNVMVKVPATQEGVQVFEELTAEGRSVSVTLLFSIARYKEIIAAYIRGLRRFHKSGGDVSAVFSVASFFVSRVDTLVDKKIESRERGSGKIAERNRLIAMKGKAAVANARLAYRVYLEEFSHSPFAWLVAHGARPQHLLWASTSTKNPAYLDVVYVEELIGPGTISSMTMETLRAFREHGRVRRSLEERLDEAERLVVDLAALGIDLEDVAEVLECEGVEGFARSWDEAVESIRVKGELGCHRAKGREVLVS